MVDPKVLSAHNGYITDACDWGVQGFLLKMILLVTAWHTVRKAMRHQAAQFRQEAVFYGGCILAAITAFLVKNITGDHSNDEMYFWIVAIAICYGNTFGPTSLSHAPSIAPVVLDDSSWLSGSATPASMSHCR